MLGTINPVAEIAARARAAGAVTLVDGSQAVPQLPVDVREIGADFYAWTGHKALGPTGIGVLHGRRELLRGDAALPRRRRHDRHGRARALDLERAALEVRGRHLADGRGRRASAPRSTTSPTSAWRTCARTSSELTAYALERLPEVEGIALFGPPDPDRRGGVVSFALEGMHPHDVAELCDREGVCIRAGHHCAQPLMRALGVPATARASASTSTTRARTSTGWSTPCTRRREVFAALAMDELYRDYILEHYKNPRNFGTLEPHDLEFHDHNPLCGDELGVHIRVEDGKIADLRFHGQGCAISQAAASIASEELIGMDGRRGRPSSTRTG